MYGETFSPAVHRPATAGVMPPRITTGDAVFLDFDGTLVEIAPSPSTVQPAGYLGALLESSSRHVGAALAIVSGRPIQDIDCILAPLVLPVAGLHGLERRGADGAYKLPPALPRFDELRAALRRFVAERPGLLLEDKGAALALHYRARPELAAETTAALETILGSARSGIAIQHGKAVMELRPEGADKGTAIAAFMAEAPFAGRRPIFVGDDMTDEAAFRAVRTQGGVAVRVGEAADTAAQWHLADVTAVHAWLADRGS